MIMNTTTGRADPFSRYSGECVTLTAHPPPLVKSTKSVFTTFFDEYLISTDKT